MSGKHWSLPLNKNSAVQIHMISSPSFLSVSYDVIFSIGTESPLNSKIIAKEKVVEVLGPYQCFLLVSSALNTLNASILLQQPKGIGLGGEDWALKPVGTRHAPD